MENGNSHTLFRCQDCLGAPHAIATGLQNDLPVPKRSQIIDDGERSVFSGQANGMTKDIDRHLGAASGVGRMLA